MDSQMTVKNVVDSFGFVRNWRPSKVCNKTCRVLKFGVLLDLPVPKSLQRLRMSRLEFLRCHLPPGDSGI
ncbi:hypothetical protein HYQ46_000819 [Verticillium longisporum]|nr:hypothetical protein HYQ46_000819 [Verticillium longisporum]